MKELNESELKNISGGMPWNAIVAGVVAVGAAAAWCFEKGEELGRALAENY